MKHRKHGVVQDDENFFSLAEYVDEEMEGMANFIKQRLIERRAREGLEGANLSPASFAQAPTLNNSSGLRSGNSKR